ncbi:hypothetical protein DLM75_01765 [Leptospira stimsonii]|uniref:Uncharacterized protein n=1 Tax=Leptospira stimsonii TaxID=2202203 RepID=A0A396ZBS1_9LEPT|nr:hypothetical protein DLM75_01765 [Leptospira stimsonii]
MTLLYTVFGFLFQNFIYERREHFGLSETDKSWFLPLSLDEASDERVNKRLFRFKFVVFHKKNLID